MVVQRKGFFDKSFKESQTREDELVTFAAAVQENQEKGAERKGVVLKSFEVWVRYRAKSALCKEEARRAEDGAPEVRETFEKNLAKMQGKDDMLEEETRMMADQNAASFLEEPHQKDKPDQRPRRFGCSFRRLRLEERRETSGKNHKTSHDTLTKTLTQRMRAKGGCPFTSPECAVEEPLTVYTETPKKVARVRKKKGTQCRTDKIFKN